MTAIYPALNERPIKNTIVLFDVDGTLTYPRGPATPEMLTLLTHLRQKVAIGFVGGSDLPKQQEQLGSPDVSVLTLFDYCFSENGLTAYRLGVPLSTQTFISHVGEARYKELVNFMLRYIADLDIPIKRGTFVEFRNGMVNVSPVGRNASKSEREAYLVYDLEHKIREKFVEALRKQFPDFGLTYSIGGQISFDVFPTGWDKRYCLQHLANEAKAPDGVEYTTIHFFGDKTEVGGNDYEIFNDERTVGHAVSGFEDTMAQIRVLFDL
ncbi:hypothetical protein VTL71DRAFT_4167 [Oculimacula yallundae]|uniref:Phosphomannomutase n=1 Tax=Oculimacula yallundae TaxID=86028 RepID=A0ABR4C696_9HELO